MAYGLHKLTIFLGILTVCHFAAPSYVIAQNQGGYLQNFFAGSIYRFAFGSGVSANNPRVELVVRYCRNGSYFSQGRTCRPNRIARGFQCTPLNDRGRWRAMTQGRKGALQWRSNRSGPGSLELFIRNNGQVVDGRGNRFTLVGPAKC